MLDVIDKIIHRVSAFRGAKETLSDILYDRVRSGFGKNQNNAVRETIYGNLGKVRLKNNPELWYGTITIKPDGLRLSKNVCEKIKAKHFLIPCTERISEASQLYRHCHTLPAVYSVKMEGNEASENLIESNRDAARITVNNGVKETGEKRKSEEIEEPEKCRSKKRRGGGGKKLAPGERYVPPPQKRNPGVSFSEEHFGETSYYFEGGLRKVYPYYFDYKTYCKGRWIGKTLREVFSSEFRAEPLEYYNQAVKKGRIRLNETPVDNLEITLKNNDFMRNTVHRHEPPVSSRPLQILVDDGEVVVVDKPASLPVHPCGRFRHNTVIFILGKERGLSGLHTVHRLDRLTSGVLLFARTLEVSKRLDQLVRDRQLEKEYVCRVVGEFPEEEVVCEEPILVVSFKVGVCRVDPKGKPCRTVFQRLSWNGRSSVVRCRPLTGRTHQIRVHLQYLGHPILNDPIYGSSAWGPTMAKGGLVGMTDEQLLQALVEEHRSKESLHLLDLPDDGLAQGGGAEAGSCEGDNGGARQGPDNTASDCSGNAHRAAGEPPGASDVCEAKRASDICQDAGQLKDQETNVGNGKTGPGATTDGLPGHDSDTQGTAPEENAEGPGVESTVDSESQESTSGAGCGTQFKDPLCSECKIVRPDPSEKDLVMYLHALRYKGPDFEYCTQMPKWAQEDWEED